MFHKTSDTMLATTLKRSIESAELPAPQSPKGAKSPKRTPLSERKTLIEDAMADLALIQEKSPFASLTNSLEKLKYSSYRSAFSIYKRPTPLSEQEQQNVISNCMK